MHKLREKKIKVAGFQQNSHLAHDFFLPKINSAFLGKLHSFIVILEKLTDGRVCFVYILVFLSSMNISAVILIERRWRRLILFKNRNKGSFQYTYVWLTKGHRQNQKSERQENMKANAVNTTKLFKIWQMETASRNNRLYRRCLGFALFRFVYKVVYTNVQ